MKKPFWLICFLFSAAGLFGQMYGPAPAASAKPAASATDDALAKQMVEKLWTAFAKPDEANLQMLQKLMTANFQSMHEDGPRTGPEELKLIAGLKMPGYTLDKYKVSRSGDVLLVSYMATVAETIDGVQQKKDTMPRLDVFQQIGGEWKWLAHVNIRPLVVAPAK